MKIASKAQVFGCLKGRDNRALALKGLCSAAFTPPMRPGLDVAQERAQLHFP
jgi:hypothetical protein